MKLKYVKFYLFFTCLLANPLGYAISVVTNGLGGGWLGDKFVTVIHAKWIAYKYNIPYVYTPFPYSDQFIMHDTERRASEFAHRRQVVVKDVDVVIDPTADVLYVVPYYQESHFDHAFCPRCVPVDWTDRGFVNELRNFIKPRFPVTTPTIPEGYISVAVHVRKGTGFDDPNVGQWAPAKLPPDAYYIEQLKRIADMFSDKALFVYIFTDHDKPLDLVNKFKAAVNKNNLTFATREIGNAYNRHVIDDFFGLTTFDCLIRPESNFSIVASKLHDYKVLITPYHNVGTTIDKVKIEINDERGTSVEII